MRRVLLHKQSFLKFNSAGPFLFFFLLISCVPVTVWDDGLEALQGTPIFLCKQSDSGEQSAPSVILESFIAKGPSKPQANQTLDNTLWALNFDREVWHGDLVDVQHEESTLNASFLTPDGRIEKQWSELNLKLKSPVAENIGKDGNGMLVMHCNPRYSINNLSEYAFSTRAKCSEAEASQAQSSTITTGGNALPGKVMILPSPHAFNPMIFRFHDRCAWTDQAGSTKQRYWDSNALSFFDGNKAVRTLELDLNSSLSSSMEQKTLKERITRLLDEKSTKHVCNQGTSKEFAVKNMRSLPLQVYSLMVQVENNRTHGFRVDFLGNFHLGPGESAKLLISYQPDFPTGVTHGDLQLVTSAGLLSLGLKANVHSFCQNAAFFATAKDIFLTVCTTALILVLSLFGKMLKQEGSEANQWSSTSNTAQLSHRSPGKSQSLQSQNGKSSSIRGSIDSGRTHINSRQYRNLSSLTKAFGAVISRIIGLKFYILCVWSAQQSDTRTVGKSDTHAKRNDNPTSPAISVAGKKRSSAQPRACSKLGSMIYSGRGSSALRSKVSIYRKEKPIPQLDVTTVVDMADPESPTSILSDKEEKTKQRGRKKRTASLVPGSENGSDSGSSSPRSIPSSPMTRDTSCRPVTPLGSGSHVPIQNRKAKLDSDDTMHSLSNKDCSKMSHWQCSTDSHLPALENASLRIASKVQVEDRPSLQAKSVPKSAKSIAQMDNGSGILSAKPTEMIPAIKPAVRNSDRRDVITKARGATLTVSATFPSPGQRLLDNNTGRVQEDRQRWPMVPSSSSPDLVSTSVVAPHARAPGSPLSPRSPSSRSPFSPSLFTTFSGSPLSSSSSTQMRTRRSQEGSVKDGAFWPQLMYANLHFIGTRKGTGFYPYHMREPHYTHKRKEPHRGSESVIPYDIWGDHFADLGRRCGPYWVGKDASITKKPSPLPPLLQTPAFSVFSSNHPYSR